MNKKLKNTSRIYFDTNIFIYFLEENTYFSDSVENVFNLCNKYNIEILTSEITITECLIGAHKKKNTELIETYQEFFKDIYKSISIIPVKSHILSKVPETASSNHLKLVDSIHVATALLYGCDSFLTNDKGISSDTMNVIILSELYPDSETKKP